MAQGEKVLVVRASGDPMSFNPSTLADDFAYAIVQNIYNRLVKLDAAKEVIPDLAHSWEVSEDGRAITFHLRDDAFWHDGEPVTSADVKYTFDTIRANPSYYFSSRMQLVESVEAPDDYSVVFHTEEPDASLIADLGWYATFIIPKHLFDVGIPWEDNPVSMDPIGSGPFKFHSFRQGVGTTLVPNPDYHEGAPKLDRLIFSIVPDDATAVQALINGEIDVLEGVPATDVPILQADPNIRLVLNEYPSPMRIIFNHDHPLSGDPVVRRAIAYAIDRDEISTKIFNGIQPPEYSMYPSLIGWAANTVDTAPHFDIEAAVQLLEDAGHTRDADGFFIRGLTIDVFEGWGYPDAAMLISATLRQAGIELRVQVHEFNAWFQKVGLDRDFILQMQGGFMGPDPNALYNRYATGVGGNYGNYSNLEFDELLRQARSTGDQEERARLYKEAQAILAAELPFLPLVAYAAYDANRTEFVNLPIDGAGRWGWQEYTFTDVR